MLWCPALEAQECEEKLGEKLQSQKLVGEDFLQHQVCEDVGRRFCPHHRLV